MVELTDVLYGIHMSRTEADRLRADFHVSEAGNAYQLFAGGFFGNVEDQPIGWVGGAHVELIVQLRRDSQPGVLVTTRPHFHAGTDYIFTL